MESHWIETDSALELRSADHEGFWSIRWSGCLPGLYWAGTSGQSGIGPVLGGLGLTAAGRADVGETNEKNMVQLEVVQNRAEMTFLPPSWHDTKIRLCWWPTAPGQFDLMSEVSTRSVGLLKGVELGIFSTMNNLDGSRDLWVEEFRDHDAALRSTDGRDVAWIKNQQHIQPESLNSEESKPWSPILLSDAYSKLSVLEMTHPYDISRRFRDKIGLSIRTWTFGYDMERGVVFRGRHRCRLINPSEIVDQSYIENWQNEFAGQPLPLFG